MTTIAVQESRSYNNLFAAFNSGDFFISMHNHGIAHQRMVDKGEILCYNLRNEQKQEVI